MAPSNETDDPNDAVLSDPPMEETTATTKRQCLNSSTGTLTLTLTLTPPSSSSNSLPLPTLPFEIFIDILSRLPVKFLMQLQCVCKSWKSLISDAKFAKKHLRVSTTRHPLVLLTFSKPSPEFVITAYSLSSIFTEVNPTATATQLQYPVSNLERFNIVGSSHGIICIRLHQSFLILWNPSINKFTKLPSLEYPPPMNMYSNYGFGYHHSTHTYKVVAVSCTISSRGYQAQTHVHTMGTNFWTRIADFPFCVSGRNSKFVSGTCNWLISEGIVSLDLETGSYRLLLQPDYGGMVVYVVSSTLDVLMDCLCIVADVGTCSDVWLMKEYGNTDSWTKLFRVPQMQFAGFSICTRALYVYEDQVLLEYHTLECEADLVVYNFRDGTFKTLQIQNTAGCMVPQVYQDSLISPCS